MPFKTLVTKYLLLSGAMVVLAIYGYSQNPTSCASIGQRANSNGSSNSCPNVNGTAYASNFAGTVYATVPSGSKTGNVQFTYAGANTGLLPYAITNVWLTTTGTSIQSVSFGPASVPTVSGGNTQVNYCFYGTNLPTAGTLSFQLTDPQTGQSAGICSYDASCNSNCTVVANPATLPVLLESFAAQLQQGAVTLKWVTAQEQNNKGFTIERRDDSSSTFHDLAFISSANAGGNSSQATSYQYTDQSLPGVSQAAYRLRQQDLDGRTTFSQIVTISISATGSVPVIFSAGNQLHIYAPPTVNFDAYNVQIYDTQGKCIKRVHTAKATAYTIDDLPRHSVYYIRVVSDAGLQVVTKSVYIN